MSGRPYAEALWCRCYIQCCPGFAQDTGQSSAQSTNGSQINVNWLYGSYVPKNVPLQPLDGHMRFKLYIRQTYTTWGIYVKTIFFSVHDQVHHTYPEWGDGFDGFVKRVGTRQTEFTIQNSTIALGDGLVGLVEAASSTFAAAALDSGGALAMRSLETSLHI